MLNNNLDDDEDLALDERDLDDMEEANLPTPPMEDQALHSRLGNHHRHIRRIDRGVASEISRNNRNTPSEDVIDIPAFLRSPRNKR
jgi:hypothetical protein